MHSLNLKTIIFFACIFLNSVAIAAERSLGSNDMAQRASAELKAALSLETKPANEIINLILQEKFLEFESLSKKYEEEFQKNPLYESPLIKLYSALDSDNPLLLQKLEKWIALRPSYISYCARGTYKELRGYAARGSNYIADTPKENIEKMQELHQEARSDLQFSITNNKGFAPAYRALINVEMASGSAKAAKRAVKEAVRWIPRTYYIRHVYLASLHPRWGGSYSKMQRYTDSLDEAAQFNPRIWSLKAEIDAERGYSAWLEKDYAAAIKYYTDALSYGDRLEFLKNRGKIFMALKEFDAAKRDFSRFIAYKKNDLEVNDYIAYIDKLNK